MSSYSKLRHTTQTPQPCCEDVDIIDALLIARYYDDLADKFCEQVR